MQNVNFDFRSFEVQGGVRTSWTKLSLLGTSAGL